MAKKRGMGLLGKKVLTGAKQKSESNVSDLRIEKVDVAQLVPGEYQPRQQFDEEALKELSESIKIQGIVQPIVVKTLGESKYEIIAGERRWRAAKLAGLVTVPVVVRKADNQTTLAMALIENIQREDLNPIEVAIALKRLMKEFELNQQAVADAVGRSRASVANLLRLLKLPEKIQNWLHDGLLTMGHARAIVTLPEELQVELAQKAIDRSWTVREMESAVQEVLIPKKLTRKDKPKIDPVLKDHQESIAKRMNAKVKISTGAKGRGKIEIAFTNEEEMNRILQELNS